MTKDFRGSNAAAKAWLRGGFCPPKPNAPPKSQKLSFCTVPKTVSQNRRATGARMGLVSTRKLVDIMPSFMPCHVAVCVNSILGAKVLLLQLFHSQQDKLFCPARLREMTFSNVSLLFGWCEVKIWFYFAGAK